MSDETAHDSYIAFEEEFAHYQQILVASQRVPASRDVIMTEARRVPIDAVKLLTQKRTRRAP